MLRRGNLYLIQFSPFLASDTGGFLATNPVWWVTNPVWWVQDMGEFGQLGTSDSDSSASDNNGDNNSTELRAKIHQ